MNEVSSINESGIKRETSDEDDCSNPNFNRKIIVCEEVDDSAVIKKDENDPLEVEENTNLENSVAKPAATLSRHFPAVCKFCNYYFSCDSDALEHMRAEHPSEKPFQCDFCVKSFTTLLYLRVHKKRMHLCNSEIACATCGKQFKTGRELETHRLRKHEDPQNWKFPCAHCERRFATKRSLDIHIVMHNPDKSFKCDRCDKAYSRKNALRSHYKQHTTGLPVKTPCNICGYCSTAFSSPRSLADHVRSKHTFEKPFKCESCDKEFASKVYYQMHKRTHSSNGRHVCNFCEKDFQFSHSLRRHVVEKHESQQSLRFACADCGRGFYTKHSLDVHRMRHTGEKQFCCRSCNRSFYTKYDLQTHMSVHSDKKGFECDVCGGRFKGACSLRRHKKEIHRMNFGKEVRKNEDRVRCSENEGNADSENTSEIKTEAVDTFENEVDCGETEIKREIDGVNLKVKSENKQIIDEVCDEKCATIEVECKEFVESEEEFIERPSQIETGDIEIKSQDLNDHLFVCPSCAKTFKTKNEQKLHIIRIHDDRQTWKHVCTYCNSRFYRKSWLDNHILKHAGVKKVKLSCHLCKRKFCSALRLQIHIGTHTGEKRLTCNLCFRQYKFLYSLQSHLKTVHDVGTVNPRARAKNQECGVCKMKFYSRYKVRLHMSTHTKDKPFRCDLCTKKYRYPSNLRSHRRKVHSVVTENFDAAVQLPVGKSLENVPVR